MIFDFMQIVKLFSGVFTLTYLFLSLLTSVFGFAYWLRNRHKRIFWMLSVYSFMSFAQISSSSFPSLTPFYLLRNYFPVFELFIFTIFFKSEMNTKWIRKYFPVSFTAFCIYYLILSIGNKDLKIFPLGATYTIENLLLILPIIYYYKETFEFTSEVILSTNPSFWIATGISILVFCSLPITFFEMTNDDQINETWQTVMDKLNIFIYIVMDILFIYAFSCKIKTLESQL